MNVIKYDLLDYYLDPNTIVEMHKKFGCNKIDSILNKSPKKDSGAINEMIDQIDTLRKTNQSPPEKAIAERVKSRTQRAKTLKRRKEKRSKIQEAERCRAQKTEKWLKILTPNKLLSRLLVLLAVNNYKKLKSKSRQKMYLLKITKTLYNNLINLL